VGVDDDLGFAEKARGIFRKPEQDAAVALPLAVAPDAGEGLLGSAQ
jgi:hypothetical protein